MNWMEGRGWRRQRRKVRKKCIKDFWIFLLKQLPGLRYDLFTRERVRVEFFVVVLPGKG